jgi:hypothetical protein
MGDDLKALPPLDESVYKTLAAAFRTAAASLKTNNDARIAHVQSAVRQWTGATQEAFITRFETGYGDNAEMFAALHVGAMMVDGGKGGATAGDASWGVQNAGTVGAGGMNLLEAAQRENRRRSEAKAWLDRRESYRNNDSVWDSFNDFIGNDPDWESIPEIGPMPAPVPEPFLQAPAPNPGGGGGGRNQAV